MQSNKTCPILEQYLNYLTIIKGRSNNTILEYRIDILYFFKFISEIRRIPQVNFDFSYIDINFIKSISINDMYFFISYCQTDLSSSARNQG
ncbi:MAG: integrase family protein [Herbinix sp.]|jgi:site-specific recombinase XerD|nr:integrase family protein [Herbinix sp.]